jgi:hypothetical protein
MHLPTAVADDRQTPRRPGCRCPEPGLEPEEITLPKGLQTVPAPDSPEHTQWLHQWGQHIAGRL